jgi:hypothetical protein
MTSCQVTSTSGDERTVVARQAHGFSLHTNSYCYAILCQPPGKKERENKVNKLKISEYIQREAACMIAYASVVAAGPAHTQGAALQVARCAKAL